MTPSSIPVGTLSRLESLNLSNNEFPVSELGTLSKLHNLRVLELGSNNIYQLPNDLVLPVLRLLDLRENPITSTEGYREDMKSRFPELMFLDSDPVDMCTWSLQRYRPSGSRPNTNPVPLKYEHEKMAELRDRQRAFYA